MQPLRRVSGAHVVYETLRERIGSLALAPGTRLHEVELATSLAVSRTPVREALRMLLAEGLVQQLPTGGVVVASLDPGQMRDLYVVRAALEGVAAREACPKLTADDVRELEALVDQMSRLVDYPDEMLRLGNAFHDRVLAAAGNVHCEQVVRQLKGHLARYQAVTATIAPRRRDAYAEHRAILEALQSGDPDEAERRARAHVMAAYEAGSEAGTEAGPSPAPA